MIRTWRRSAGDVLQRLFSSRVRVALVTYFVMNPDQRRRIRGLAKAVPANYSAVWKELRNLEAAGLVVSEEEAGRRFFKLNPDFPLVDELRGMVLKTVGAGDSIRQALRGVPDIQAAFIYGSYADGRVDAQSDIDIIVIGEVELEQLSSTISHLEQALRRSVSVVTYTPHEWKAKLQQEDPFALDVLRRPKLMLVGSEDAL